MWGRRRDTQSDATGDAAVQAELSPGASALSGGGSASIAAEEPELALDMQQWPAADTQANSAAAQLTAAPRYPIRLHPNEWRSGDVFWIIDAVREQQAVQQCVEALTKTVFQEKPIKILPAAQGQVSAQQ